MGPERQLGGVPQTAGDVARHAAERSMRDGADWRTFAACKDADPEIFTYADDKPRNAIYLEAAKEVCKRCAVVQECLDDAMAVKEYDMYRAKMTGDQLSALARQNRRRTSSNRHTNQ